MLLPLLPIILLLPLSTRDVKGDEVAALAVAASAASCRRRCRHRRRHRRRRRRVDAAIVDVGWRRHRIRVEVFPNALARRTSSRSRMPAPPPFPITCTTPHSFSSMRWATATGGGGDPTVYSYPFIRACRTLPSSPLPPRHCCLRRHYRCRHISCRHCSHRPYHRPCHRLPFVDCCRSHHRLVVVSWVPIYPAFRSDKERAVSNGLLVHLLLRPQIKVTMRTMMLPMLWRDCLG